MNERPSPEGGIRVAQHSIHYTGMCSPNTLMRRYLVSRVSQIPSQPSEAHHTIFPKHSSYWNDSPIPLKIAHFS